MYASTCWGSLGLAFTFGLAVLGLTPDYMWLQPYLIWSAISCGALSVLCFLFYPARYAVRRISLHFPNQGRAQLMSLGFCLAVGGLVISLVGVLIVLTNADRAPGIRTPSSLSSAQTADLERVRDQLKINGNPLLNYESALIDGKRLITRARAGIPLRNDAPIGLSYTIRDVTTVIEGQTAEHEMPYPSKGPTLLQGESTIFNADRIELQNVGCGRVTGELSWDISYGIPNHEMHTLKRKVAFIIYFDPNACSVVRQAWNWVS